MKRADKRSPGQIAIQRATYLIGLPDTELCEIDHRTSALPKPHRPCLAGELDATGNVTVCDQPGGWGTFIQGTGARRGCSRHVAGWIRSRVWLERQRLVREYGPVAGASLGTGRPDRSGLRKNGTD